jgi:hypothetical protein
VVVETFVVMFAEVDVAKPRAVIVLPLLAVPKSVALEAPTFPVKSVVTVGSDSTTEFTVKVPLPVNVCIRNAPLVVSVPPVASTRASV